MNHAEINSQLLEKKLLAQAEKESWAKDGQDVTYGLIGNAIAAQQERGPDFAAIIQNQIAYHEKELARLSKVRSLMEENPSVAEAFKLYHAI